MSGKKKGLGRGLSALFGDEKPIDKPQKIKQTRLEEEYHYLEIRQKENYFLTKTALTKAAMLEEQTT